MGAAYGSPLGGSYDTPLKAAIHGTKEDTHPKLYYEPFDPRSWIISSDGMSQALDRLDDKSSHYRNWRSRVVDHLMTSNQNWGTLARAHGTADYAIDESKFGFDPLC